MGAWQMTGSDVANVDADEVDTNIVAEVLRYKSGYNSETIDQNDLIFWYNLSWGCPNCRWHHHININITAPLWCHQYQHLCSEGTFVQQKGWQSYKQHEKILPLCFSCTSSVLMSSLVIDKNVQVEFSLPFCYWKDSVHRSLSSLLKCCHHDVLWNCTQNYLLWTKPHSEYSFIIHHVLERILKRTWNNFQLHAYPFRLWASTIRRMTFPMNLHFNKVKHLLGKWNYLWQSMAVLY